MKYAVVIVTYNRLDLLKECLERINKQIINFFEIVVVNNASTDGTQNFLNNYKQNNLKIVNLKQNIGGAGGFEEGIKNLSTEYDYVLLIDDDAMLDENFLFFIENNIEKDIYAYSGTVFKYDSKDIDIKHRRRVKNSIYLKNESVSLSEYKQDYFYCDIASFCGLVISKEIIKKIGLPIGEYFIWYDDTEYSLRIMKYTRIKNVNKAFLVHKSIDSNQTKLNWKSYYGLRNFMDCGRKHSKIPFMFSLYKYLQYIKYTLKSLFKYLLKKDNYYKECANLYKEVLKDSFNHKLGISKKYYPGKKI